MKYCPQCACELVPTLVDNEQRLACKEQCGFVFWNNPIPVAAGLIEIDGRYLLARNKAWPDGFFSLISGFIDTGESPQQAIIRETKEELDLEGLSSELIGHYPFPQMNQLVIAYAVKATGEIRLNEELAEFIMLSKEELLNYDFGPIKLGTIAVRDHFKQ